MIGRAFREATARFFHRRPSTVVERVEAYTVTAPLRPIVGRSGEFVGWTKGDA